MLKRFKSYLHVHASDGVFLDSKVLLTVFTQIKKRKSFFGFELNDRMVIQARPRKGIWYIEYLDTALLNYRWRELKKRELRKLLTMVLAAADPLAFMEKETVNWEMEWLCVDDEGKITG